MDVDHRRRRARDLVLLHVQHAAGWKSQGDGQPGAFAAAFATRRARATRPANPRRAPKGTAPARPPRQSASHCVGAFGLLFLSQGALNLSHGGHSHIIPMGVRDPPETPLALAALAAAVLYVPFALRPSAPCLSGVLGQDPMDLAGQGPGWSNGRSHISAEHHAVDPSPCTGPLAQDAASLPVDAAGEETSHAAEPPRGAAVRRRLFSER